VIWKSRNLRSSSTLVTNCVINLGTPASFSFGVAGGEEVPIVSVQLG
jgi:hypothetical protein